MHVPPKKKKTRRKEKIHIPLMLVTRTKNKPNMKEGRKKKAKRVGHATSYLK